MAQELDAAEGVRIAEHISHSEGLKGPLGQAGQGRRDHDVTAQPTEVVLWDGVSPSPAGHVSGPVSVAWWWIMEGVVGCMHGAHEVHGVWLRETGELS